MKKKIKRWKGSIITKETGIKIRVVKIQLSLCGKIR
jgi:hypothetical protein